MKYENDEFERNFQLKPAVKSAEEPSTSANNSLSVQSRTEKSHDDIQVEWFYRYSVWMDRVILYLSCKDL